MAEDAVTVKLPNALTYAGLIGEGKTPEEANRIMHQRVFGADHKKDAAGKPVEQGRGAPGNETAQHKEALRLSLERKAQAQPNNADVITAAVAAGIKAGMAAAKEEQL